VAFRTAETRRHREAEFSALSGPSAPVTLLSRTPARVMHESLSFLLRVLASLRCPSLCRAAQNHGATIAFMAKFKPARAKPKRTAPPPGAVSCVILVLAGMLLVMLFMYFVMRNANG